MKNFFKGIGAFIVAVAITVSGYYLGIMTAILGGILLIIAALSAVVGVVAFVIYGCWTVDKDDPPEDKSP